MEHSIFNAQPKQSPEALKVFPCIHLHYLKLADITVDITFGIASEDRQQIFSDKKGTNSVFRFIFENTVFIV